MVTVFQNLLDCKRAELEKVRIRYEALQHDVAALERAATQELPPSLSAEALAPAVPHLPRKEKHARRVQQILELFRHHGGVLHLSAIMAELGISKNAAKEWMNTPIDQAPADCPWERVDGNRSRFRLKDHQSRPEPAPADERPGADVEL